MTSVAHDQTVIDQFTRQAIPFARAPQHQHGIDAIRRLARLQAGDDVLDVACGPGLVACALAPYARRVTGIDLTPEMLAEARRAQDDQRLPNLEWRLGTAIPLPFADAAFSVVITRYSFHHFADPHAAFDEMVRVCRPNGRIVVCDLSLPREQGARFDAVERLRDPSHVRVLDPCELDEWFRGASLAERDEERYGLDIELEPQLARSFPVADSLDLIRAAYRADIAHDALGIHVREVDGRIWSTWPVRVLAGTRS